jgi:hypothetical protein
MRFMFILKSSTPATAPSPELMGAMHELALKEVKAGRMIADGGLMPRSMAQEVRLRRRKLAVIDGPFAETKEVIGGFAIFELPDRQAAVDSALAFLGLHQEHLPDSEFTMEIREIAGSQVEMIRQMAEA